MRSSPSGVPGIDPPTVRRLPRPNPGVVFCEVEEGAVLLSTEEEAYYGLNPVGALVWSHLTEPHQTLEGICLALAAAYPGVDLEDLRRDVQDLLDDLLRNGLVVSV